MNIFFKPKIKIALGIEYNGFKYYGWQYQKNFNTIQNCLESAIKKITKEKIRIYCGGRTDSKVHATGQVIHFYTSVFLKKSAWILGINNFLPDDISVCWSKIVNFDFHARYSAISRTYCYIIFNNLFKSSIFTNCVSHYPIYLDVKKMHIAAQLLVGKKDFTSFRSSKCQSKSAWRDVKFIKVKRYFDYIIIEIQANSFLYHMVRNIIGSLLEIGYGRKNKKWLSDVLYLRDRTKAAATAKPNGLYLVSIDYPDRYNIPKLNSIPFFK